jgi:hypothetical protein
LGNNIAVPHWMDSFIDRARPFDEGTSSGIAVSGGDEIL